MKLDPKKIQLRPVNSSCISYVGYDRKTRHIVLQWKKGGAWWAYPATFREYLQMLTSDSIGQYVNTYLVPRKGAFKIKVA